MLDFFQATSRNCQGISRRAFLRVGALSGLGLSLPGLFAGRQASAAQGRKTKDVSCILIWTLGGTSHHDTFDPKPDAPAEIRGAFRTVQASNPELRVCEHLPRMAKLASRYAVLRTMTHDDLYHGTACYLSLTGQFHQKKSGNPPVRASACSTSF